MSDPRLELLQWSLCEARAESEDLWARLIANKRQQQFIQEEIEAIEHGTAEATTGSD